MTMTRSDFIAKNLSMPEHLEELPKRREESVTLGRVTIGRGTLEPGWRWSEHVKPLVGTESCQAQHIHHVVSGRLRVRLNDGAEQEFVPGDAFSIPPGHDGWVVGDEPVVLLDFTDLVNASEQQT